MIRHAGSTMTESAPFLTSFKITEEREPSLNEFRERMSARLHSRKSSAVTKRSTKSRQPTASVRYRTENSNITLVSNQPSETDTGQMSPKSFKSIRKSDIVDTARDRYPSGRYSSASGAIDHDSYAHSGHHVRLNGDMKYMLDHAYANYESEAGGLSVKTPPKNMQIKDLMLPLDEWGFRDSAAIREKKYAVLPSIHTPPADGSGADLASTRTSIHSRVSINNQLDFFRDKIEQEADFFADFRVNTNKVKTTPRQDPLPPIKLNEMVDNVHRNSSRSRKSRNSSKATHRDKPKFHL